MKSVLSNKRSKAILVIALIAIGIGAIAKKVINYPSGGCIKGNQELTLKSEKLFIYLRSKSFNLFSFWYFVQSLLKQLSQIQIQN